MNHSAHNYDHQYLHCQGAISAWTVESTIDIVTNWFSTVVAGCFKTFVNINTRSTIENLTLATVNIFQGSQVYNQGSMEVPSRDEDCKSNVNSGPLGRRCSRVQETRAWDEIGFVRYRCCRQNRYGLRISLVHDLSMETSRFSRPIILSLTLLITLKYYLTMSICVYL